MNLHKILSFLFFWLLCYTANAADLVFTPTAPIVEVGEKMTLTVSGGIEPLTWSAQKGWVIGVGTEVNYEAPDQTGFDVVTVLDAAGNIGTVKVQIVEKSNISLENSVWEVFSNLDTMMDAVLLADGKTFLVSSIGGLAQFEVATGELKRMFTQQDGLPDNQVKTFLVDEAGVWIGTGNGLAYYENATDKLTHYETPLGVVMSIIADDSKEGIWVNLMPTPADLWDIQAGKKPDFSSEEHLLYAIAHLDTNKQWSVYPLNGSVVTIVSDELGGIWIATLGDENDLDKIGKENEKRQWVWRHLLSHGKWLNYTVQSLGLTGEFNPFRYEPDGQGGIWVTTPGHLIHLNLAGDSRIYSATEAGLSAEASIRPSFMNEDGTLRVSIEDEDEELIFDVSAEGVWTPVILEGRPEELHLSYYDGQDGYWFLTDDEHLWYRDADYNWTAHPDTSDYPYEAFPMADVPDGQGGVWIGTSGEGLVHLTPEGQWEKMPTSSKLPLSIIHGIGYDAQGGGWIFGFGYLYSIDYTLSQTPMLIRCKPEESELWCEPAEENLPPQITIESVTLPRLLPDDQGGLWLSTDGVGLFYRHATGQWTTYDTTNSELPSDKIWTIINDGRGGLWIGSDSGLTHLSHDQHWTTYNTNNSQIAEDDVFALETDSIGGIWIGYGHGNGLSHLSHDSVWTTYTTDNSPLPNNYITALLKENNGLWIGTGKEKNLGGLVSYLSDTGEWSTYPTEPELGSFPRFFISDRVGGIWVATLSSGLAHFDRTGQAVLFNSHNSGLPSYMTTGLLNDAEGGIWASNQFGGLAHLTFPEKQSGNRAAIVIASGGNQSDNSLWKATESTTNYLYKMLAGRGFINEEIYYLSSKDWADFNGDGFNDRIVDAPKPERPLNLDDIRQAFAWATERGKLDQPLYVFFMDHGGPERLLLGGTKYLEAIELKNILDDYQTATGSQVVLVIEACFSGSFLPILQAPNRAVITSASANEVAYFDGEQGFTRSLANYLYRGGNFLEAYKLSQRDQDQLLGQLSKRNVASSEAEAATLTQSPQLDDNGDGIYNSEQDGQWLKQVRINGSFVTADFTLAIENLTQSTTLSVGESVILQAKATSARDDIERVWAVIRPPRMHHVIDTNGTPILAFPRVYLSKKDTDLWQTTWQDAIYNGDYEITFYAEDKQGNIASSDQDTILTVNGGVDPPDSAKVQILLEKDRYQRGELFKAELIENLGWGFDLYAAVVMPDGNFLALKNTNEPRAVNEAKPWYGHRQQNQPITLFELTLPTDLPTGEYCLYGILSPEQNDVFETLEKGLWVYTQQCFEVYYHEFTDEFHSAARKWRPTQP